MTTARRGLKVKVIGQGQVFVQFLHWLYMGHGDMSIPLQRRRCNGDRKLAFVLLGNQGRFEGGGAIPD